MKKQVFCGVFALALAVTGCGVQKKEAVSDIVPENRQELTILHVDAGAEGFDSFISQAEKDLGIKIHIEKCPANADNRQAKIATLLTSGDDSVDLITVNDEMISEFKHKGFLLPLEDTGYDRGDSGEFSAGIPERNMHVRRTYFFGTVQNGYHGILGEPGIAGSGWSGQTLLSQ